MASNHRHVRAKTGDKELSASETTTDSPLIPIDLVEKLHSVRPDLVDWFIKETQAEAEHRRMENSRVNRFIFIERIIGQLFGLVTVTLGLGGAVYLGLRGWNITASVIGGGSLASLAGVFIYGSKKNR